MGIFCESGGGTRTSTRGGRGDQPPYGMGCLYITVKHPPSQNY